METIESFLEVGLTMYLDPSLRDGGQTRYRVVARGWLPGSWILFEIPSLDEETLKELPSLVLDHLCGFRFVSNGNAVGFTAAVIDMTPIAGTEGMPGLRVAWPETVETVGVRVLPRATVCVPGELVTSGGKRLSVELLDLSAGGCQVTWADSQSVSVGESVQLSFTLPGGLTVKDLSATVRSRRVKRSKWLTGCKFGGMDEVVRNGISLYVLSMVEGQRGKFADRLVILESDIEAVRQFASELRHNEYEVVVVEHLMDAAYWLEEAHPRAFLLNREQKEIAATEVCRLVRSAPSTEGVTILVYGAADPTLEQQLRDAGATVCFSSVPSLDELLGVLEQATAVPTDSVLP